MTSLNITFINVIGVLYRIVLNENRNTAFIWSDDMLYFPQTNKRHIYVTPVRCKYFVIHYMHAGALLGDLFLKTVKSLFLGNHETQIYLFLFVFSTFLTESGYRNDPKFLDS